jgi:hypothetical protein
MDKCMLSAGRGLASASGNSVPRPGTAPLAVHGLSDLADSIRTDNAGSQGACAVGPDDSYTVRGRNLDCSSAHANAWSLGRGWLKMRTVVLSMILGSLSLQICCVPACADGGSMRLSEKKGGYQISVFTAPTPFRAGPVDISVLVQDGLTGDFISRSQVTVRLTQRDLPPLEYPATVEAATNKIFRAAQFELPAPGRWKLQVQIEGLHGLAVVGTEVEAAGPLPRWRDLWLWIGWPALVIVIFGVHQVFVRRSGSTGPRKDSRPLETTRPIRIP